MAVSAWLQPARLRSSPCLFTFYCSIEHLNIKMGLAAVQDFQNQEPGVRYQSAYKNTECIEVLTGLKKASSQSEFHWMVIFQASQALI